MPNPWVVLLIAGLLEVGWAVGLPFTRGFTRFWPSVVTLTAMAGSMYLLALAARQLPIGTAYAVWTGIGAAGTAAIGMLWLNEPRSAARVACLLLIISGIAGLKLLSAPSAGEQPTVP